jgi:hypothetical protein
MSQLTRWQWHMLSKEQGAMGRRLLLGLGVQVRLERHRVVSQGSKYCG